MASPRQPRNKGTGSVAVSLFLRHAPLGAIRLSDDGRILDVNPAAEALFGISVADVQGKRVDEVEEFFGGASAVEDHSTFCDWLKQEVLTELENRHWWKGSAVACNGISGLRIELDADLFRSDDQQSPGIICLLRDVTAQRSHEHALWMRDQAILASATGILLVDVSSHPHVPIIYANPSAEKMCGLPIEDLLGIDIRSLEFAPEEGHLDLADLLQIQEPRTGLFQATAAGAAVQWIQISTGSLGSDGMTQQRILACTDVTERVLGHEMMQVANKELAKAVEERARDLETNQARFEMILAALDEVVFSAPADISIPAYVSPAAIRVYGREPAELAVLGQFHPDLVVEEDRDLMLNFKRDVFAFGSAQLDYRIVRPDGEVRWIHHRARVIRNDIAELVRVDGTAMDISERKRAEIELLAAREAADRANRAKDDFLAMMSHEIRTPLQCIFGYTELLSNAAKEEKQIKFLDVIRTQAHALLDIINDILDFSRIQSGKIEIEQIPLDLRTCIADVLKAFAPQAARKNIATFSEVEGEVPHMLCGDPGRLKQILTNLINNALKFTQEGFIRVHLSAWKEETQRHQPAFRLHFKVIDTGIGIDPSKIDRLFKKFSQVDSSTARKFGGSGLGLAVCKHLCEMMGGTIWVESQSGKGSTFHFTVLFGCSEEETAQTPVTPVELASADPSLARKHPLAILLVEDNSSVLEVSIELFRSLGYEPSTARSGLDAIRAIERDRYDLVFMDLQMPEMDGIEATQLICSKIPDEQRPRIVAMTANVLQSDRDRCLRAGMSDFIGKPVSIARIQDVILRVSRKEAPPDEHISEPSLADVTLDRDKLGELVKLSGNAENSLLERVHGMLRRETPTLLRQIRLAAKEKDAPKLEQAAHNLKGTAQILGAHRMGNICRRLIEEARSSKMEPSPADAEQLENEFRRVKAELQEFIRQQASPGE